MESLRSEDRLCSAMPRPELFPPTVPVRYLFASPSVPLGL